MPEENAQAKVSERRRFRRHPIRLEAELRYEGNRPRRCVIHDFSSRGMLLEIEDRAGPPSPVGQHGQKVEIAFRLPPDNTPVKARSRVVRHTVDDERERLAVRFGQCNAFVLDHLLELSREAEANGIACFPAHHRLVRDLYATLLSRVEAEADEEPASYFYALMALKSHEERINDHLGRLFARNPDAPFDVSLLVQPFQIAFNELRVAEPARVLIESVLADIAARRASAREAI